MGTSNRAVQNAFFKLHGAFGLEPPTGSCIETSQYQVLTDDHLGNTLQQHAGIAQEDKEVSRDPPTSNNKDEQAEKAKQEMDRRNRGRLTELDQQLKMAESRCGTLKQQLDYMRILYQGVDRTRNLLDVHGFELAEDDMLMKTKKEKRHHHHHHKRRPVTECCSLSAGSDKSQLGKQHDTLSLSEVPCTTSSQGTSSHRESTMTDLTKLTKPEDQPISDLIDFSDHLPPAEGTVEGAGGQEAVQVIQDILCGITHTVDWATGQQAGHVDENVATREAVSMLEMRPRATQQTADNIYSGSFQRVYANDSLTRKSAKTGHSPRRDHPYGLVKGRQEVDSDESLRGGVNKRKKGVATTGGSKKALDKKPRANGPYMHHQHSVTGGGKGNDDASTTTAARPKKKKLMKTRNAHSRSTLKSHRNKNAAAAKTVENIPAYSSEKIPYDTWQNNSNNLVEIYHNAAIRTETSVSEEHFKGVMNDSDTPSMMSYLKKTREEANIPGRLGVSRPATGSALRVDDTWERRSNSASGHLNHHHRSELLATDSAVGPFNRDSSKMSHFELPTVSSRMKQVDRSYMQRFNFRTIPFVVGKSTTPTHNLGLNIQQVLSMIKMRQPVTGLSPMALAGGLLRESQMPGSRHGPITSYLERMNSRPATRCRGNIFPPTIPEHDEMELPRHDDDDDDEGPYSASRTMTTTNRGTNNHKGFETYRVDWGSSHRRSDSTTFPNKKYNNYHQVLNQYLDGEQQSFLRGALPNPRLQQQKRSSTRPWRGEGEEFNKTLHHQMNGMKEVMQRLHDDFMHLSQDYEDLCVTVQRDDAGMLIRDEDHETLREMAAAVQNKENEIKLVMELLEEVSALHKMVASLNQKTSVASMTRRLGQCSPRQKQSRIVPREPTTSIRLTRLLRTIQSFQEKLKQEK